MSVTFEKLLNLGHQVNGLSLYIHVPFCASKCAYCSFCSESNPSEASLQEYLGAMSAQLKLWGSHYTQPLRSVYIGGGTPSLLGLAVVELLDGIRQHFAIEPDAEITLEANPDSVTADLVSAWTDAGINRISLGAQSFDDDLLQTLGRRHTAQQAIDVCNILRARQINYSLDLMCGLPRMDTAAWRKTLDQALLCEPSHVSVYALSVEEDTPFGHALESGELVLPEDDVVAEQMLLAEQMLGDSGIARYEIANFARSGCESKHNTGYWTGVSYIGLGPSASSMLTDAQGNRYRFTAYATPAEFTAQAASEPADYEVLTPVDARKEDIMLGLRMAYGVDAATIDQAGLSPVMRDLEQQTLVELDSLTARWCLTSQGWLLGNVVFAAVWCAEV